MESQNKPRLLFISLYLVFFSNAARTPTSSIDPAQTVSLQPPTPSLPPPSSKGPEQILSFAHFFPSPDHIQSDSDLESGSSSILETNLQADSSSNFSYFLDAKLDLGAAVSELHLDPELEKICGVTDYPQLCITAVISHLQKGNITVDAVFKAAVMASNEFAKHCQGVVEEIGNKTGNPPDLQSALDDCKDGYETVVDSFVETMDAFPSRDIGTMRSMLSAVITFVGDCQDDLTAVSAKTPLSGYAEKLTNMTSNCLAISDLMIYY